MEKVEYIVRCRTNIDEKMRKEMKATGVELDHESEVLFVVVVTSHDENHVKALRALPFVKDVMELNGMLCEHEKVRDIANKALMKDVDVYKISHYYSNDDKEDSLYIQTDKELVELIELIAALQFKLEFMTDDSVALSEEHIVELLTTFYGATDVTEIYKEKHEQFSFPKNEWGVADLCSYKEVDSQGKECVTALIQIDSYQARESCCGPECEDLIEKHVLKTEAFESAFLKLKQHYEGEMSAWKQA